MGLNETEISDLQSLIEARIVAEKDFAAAKLYLEEARRKLERKLYDLRFDSVNEFRQTLSHPKTDNPSNAD